MLRLGVNSVSNKLLLAQKATTPFRAVFYKTKTHRSTDCLSVCFRFVSAVSGMPLETPTSSRTASSFSAERPAIAHQKRESKTFETHGKRMRSLNGDGQRSGKLAARWPTLEENPKVVSRFIWLFDFLSCNERNCCLFVHFAWPAALAPCSKRGSHFCFVRSITTVRRCQCSMQNCRHCRSRWRDR